MNKEGERYHERPRTKRYEDPQVTKRREDAMTDNDKVTLFNVSFIDKNGLRTMLGPNQGRYMKATREEAETHLADLMRESEERLVDICGTQSRGTFRVDAFTCYAHGDAVGIYVDEGDG